MMNNTKAAKKAKASKKDIPIFLQKVRRASYLIWCSNKNRGSTDVVSTCVYTCQGLAASHLILPQPYSPTNTTDMVNDQQLPARRLRMG